jgi:hypothetical protein
MKSKRAPVSVDATRWSKSSKQSYSYVNPPEEYTDLEYDCWRCGSRAVFSAEDQKKTFEVRKAYIWQRRALCKPCWTEEQKIARRLQAKATEWKKNKPRLVKDLPFLREWLALLEEHPKYGVRANTGGIAMLKKQITAVDERGPTIRSTRTRARMRAPG